MCKRTWTWPVSAPATYPGRARRRGRRHRRRPRSTADDRSGEDYSGRALIVMRLACSAPTACAARRATIRSTADGARGWALRSSARCRAAAGAPRLLVGRDTRESGAWIEAELAHGATGEGADGDERRGGADAGRSPTSRARTASTPGVVISASHNPFEDNGIKVFSGRGEKFTERVERASRGDRRRPSVDAPAGGPPPRSSGPISVGAYLDHLRAIVSRTGASSAGFRLAIDCANGATTTVAPRLFRSLGFDAVVIGERARRPQHQSRLRIDASRAAGARSSSSGGCRIGRGVRRRRRPRDLRRRSRTDRQWRRRAADVRASAAARGTPEGRRRSSQP